MIKGDELFENKDYNNARFYYKYAIDTNYNNKNLFLNKGNELFKSKSYQDAIRYY